MILLTKIFHFEMAHAIHDYDGPCRNIHGHSYELHITVCGKVPENGYFSPPGFLMDFKDLKRIVQRHIIDKFDHKIILSRDYIVEHTRMALEENLMIFDAEPTAENLLLHFRYLLTEFLPAGVGLQSVKLFETKSSYAEWVAGTHNEYGENPGASKNLSHFN